MRPVGQLEDLPRAASAAGARSRLGGLSIGRRLTLLVAVLAVAVAAVAAIGALGVGKIDRNTADFYDGAFNRAALTADLEAALQRAESASLEYALIDDDERLEQLEADLAGNLVPAVDALLTSTESELGPTSGRTEVVPPLERLRRNWESYRKAFGPGALEGAVGARGDQVAGEIRTIFDGLTADARTLAEYEASEAAISRQEASFVADSTRTALIIAALVTGVVGVAIAIALSRSIVRRAAHYSVFAAAVAGGNYGERLQVGGNDELSQLGRLLNRMVEHRDAEQSQGRQRSEFTEAMQLTGSESEAHHLLKRHLERSIPESDVTVLSRNNSANRLEPTTELEAGDPIVEGLREAQPADCLAVRSGQPHRHDGEEPLLACEICGKATTSACRPLLVGGEVIGSVLARRERALNESESETMRGSVVQAAPLLANLRNLALAERRAGTDALTGLANQRASHETLKLMVAQAERARRPLAVLLLDLDHFKPVNDVFGHAAGDSVLAAVGVAMRSSIRDGDFCGRYGGEEFIALLPDTTLAAGGAVAEKVRAAIGAIKVPTVSRAIAVSIGVAAVPAHGIDADAVVRIADRALYTAKSGGRNRVALAPEGVSLGDLEPALDAANGAAKPDSDSEAPRGAVTGPIS